MRPIVRQLLKYSCIQVFGYSRDSLGGECKCNRQQAGGWERQGESGRVNGRVGNAKGARGEWETHSTSADPWRLLYMSKPLLAKKLFFFSQRKMRNEWVGRAREDP